MRPPRDAPLHRIADHDQHQRHRRERQRSRPGSGPAASGRSRPAPAPGTASFSHRSSRRSRRRGTAGRGRPWSAPRKTGCTIVPKGRPMLPSLMTRSPSVVGTPEEREAEHAAGLPLQHHDHELDAREDAETGEHEQRSAYWRADPHGDVDEQQVHPHHAEQLGDAQRQVGGDDEARQHEPKPRRAAPTGSAERNVARRSAPNVPSSQPTGRRAAPGAAPNDVM